jgi:sortase A
MTGKHRGGPNASATAETLVDADRSAARELGRRHPDAPDAAGHNAAGHNAAGLDAAGHNAAGYDPDAHNAAANRRNANRPDARGLGDGGRAAVRGLGELLLTCGVVLLLFLCYEVWVSNLFAARKQAQVREQLITAWERGQDPLKGADRRNLPIGKQVALPAGQGFANLYIPRLGKDYVRTVVQGTSDRDLASGPGHYVTSQLPGQLGNFAVAGHRVSKGQPFLNLDRLRPGDKIIVQTARNWYVYAVLGSRSAYLAASRLTDPGKREAAIAAALATPDSQGVRGREIVHPAAVHVIDPVPNHPRAVATRALLTLTTCHPKYSADQRLIVHAQLSRAVPRAGSRLPHELPGGTI